MLFETERLTVRGWTVDDLPAYRQMAVDAGYNCFSIPGFFSYRDEAELKEKVASRARHFSETGFGKHLVFEKGSDAFVGTCGIDPYQANGTPIHELGYRLMLSHWGKGYATEAATGAMKYYFEVLELPTLHAFALPQNAASLKIIGKLGFERCGEVSYNGLVNHLFAKTSHRR